MGIISDLPDNARWIAESFIEHWNGRGYDAEFWRTDCSLVFEEIVEDARRLLASRKVPTSDQLLFDLFVIVTLNFAHSASRQRSFRKFAGIRKSFFRT